MPPKKRHQRQSISVVRTERDTKRAIGDPEVDEFKPDEVKPMIADTARLCYTRSYLRLRRAKARKSLGTIEEPFPFLTLPSEVRNMIYRYVVISKASERICLTPFAFMSGGIETAILVVNRQIYGEAAKILYEENKFLCICGTASSGPPIRHDYAETESATLHNLRSGLHVDMRSHHGLIYRKNFLRIRHVEFRIELFLQTNFYATFNIRDAIKLRDQFLGLSRLLRHRKLAERFEHERDWIVTIQCCDQMPYVVFRTLLEPMRRFDTMPKLTERNMRIVPTKNSGWKRYFRLVAEAAEAAMHVDSP